MKRYLILSMIGVVGFTMLLSLFTVTTAFAQSTPSREEYMQQHDGGDRAEYLQEMEHNDPWFYVPPVNDASLSATTDNYPPTK
jgi:hypothetical protein